MKFEMNPAFAKELQYQASILKEEETEPSYVIMQLQHMIEENYDTYSQLYGEYFVGQVQEWVKEMVKNT